MKLPDTNVLLYTVNRASPHHAQAIHWLEGALNGTEPVAFAWLALVGFVRVSTRKGILPTPLDLVGALEFVDQCLHADNARVVHPGERHAGLLGRLLMGAGTAGNLTNDAHLAALAIEHGATMVSFDHDFQRFTGLRFELLQ